MAKKYLLFVILTCFAVIQTSYTNATDLGINAGVLLPAGKFDDRADIGYTIGKDIKLDVYETF